MNASVSHAHGLQAAGVSAEVWTASTRAEELATALRVPVFRDDAVAEPWEPLRSAAARARARAAGPVDAVLHQGARSWAWAWAFWPTATHAVRFPNYRIRDRRLFRNWMAVSSRHAERLRSEKTLGLLTPNVAVVKNGEVQSKAKVTTTPAVPRRAFRADGRLILGALGTLEDRKGQDVLIDALADLRGRGIDAALRLGGAGGDGRADLLARAERLGVAEHIEAPGWVDAVEFLAGLDVFCLPSRSEPFGIVLIEAMAQGLPVIASDVDGPADILADGSGLLVPVGEAKALADAVAGLATDPARADRLAQAAKSRAADAYGPAAVGRSIIDAFNQFGARLIPEPRLAPSIGD